MRLKTSNAKGTGSPNYELKWVLVGMLKLHEQISALQFFCSGKNLPKRVAIKRLPLAI